MKILLTSFHPFRDRERNASQTIAASLAELPTPHTLLHLTLPVLWGSIETIALPQIAAFQPDLILGLGEGPPSALQFETRATNRRHGPDESGTLPDTDTIAPTGPAEVSARWPIPVPPTPSIQLSTNAGRYLCNNALYRYALTPAAYVAFLHLPPQSSTPSTDYLDKYLPTVQTFLNLTHRNP